MSEFIIKYKDELGEVHEEIGQAETLDKALASFRKCYPAFEVLLIKSADAPNLLSLD